MAGYFVAKYTITNQAEYRQYLAAAGPTLVAHGAETIVIDRDRRGGRLRDRPGR